MYIDREELNEYPFDGFFYIETEDESLPPSEREKILKEVFRTKCDIQQSAKAKSSASGFITSSYNIYFPFDKSIGVSIRQGMIFKGSMYDMEVDGEVIGVFPTQLGGCSVTIKDLE